MPLPAELYDLLGYGVGQDDPRAGGLGFGSLAMPQGQNLLDAMLYSQLAGADGVGAGAPQGQLPPMTQDELGNWWMYLGEDIMGTPQWDMVQKAERPGAGGVGRTLFPEERANIEAETAYTQALMEMLMPQFGLQQEQFGLQQQQQAWQEAEDLYQRKMSQAYLEFQQGQLSLSQLQTEIDYITSEKDRALEEKLGMRGLDITEQLGLGGLASEAADRALQRELGFAGLEEQQKDRALTSAMGAISSYLQGMSQADARRVSAFQETRALIPFMVDPERETWFNPEGPLAAAAGPGFDPGQIHHIDVPDPAQLAQAPSQEQVGGGLMDLIGGLQ